MLTTTVTAVNSFSPGVFRAGSDWKRQDYNYSVIPGGADQEKMTLGTFINLGQLSTVVYTVMSSCHKEKL